MNVNEAGGIHTLSGLFSSLNPFVFCAEKAGQFAPKPIRNLFVSSVSLVTVPFLTARRPPSRFAFPEG